MKKEVCIACENKLRLLGISDGKNIFICPKCGLGKTIGIGNHGQYNAYHRDLVYIKATDQFKNIFTKRLNIISRFKDKGKVLEVGSSTGLFLSLLKDRGWEVLGIEPSGESSKAARNRDIPVLNTTFELANLDDKDFDVIIFNHVLEHMENPLEALRKSKKLLKKGGIIFIDVPNFASLSARIQKIGWKYLLPKEHKWHFTPASIFLILEKVGFTPIYWEAHSGIWQYENPAREIWESLAGRKKRFFSNVLTAIPTFVLTQLKSGTGLSVVAQKIR